MTAPCDFHNHLDECPQCRDHPFDLCPVGEQLLQASVGDAPTFRPDLPVSTDPLPEDPEW
jgi:hypothetical protein